ncbi:MAG: peptide chain release factor N(5)-glutamine methyltransferase [Lachnospiraceae bacterium]|nr:peptide chain release factor N(5)-glutamine methyltransferase [Lachnospiraceae bacterium]
MKIHELLKYGRNVLSEAGVPDAEADAWLLLSDAVGLDRAGLFLCGTEPAAPEAEERYREMIAARAKRIPLQHITGKAYFMGLTFHSDARTLVPRPDTETLVEAVLEEVSSGGTLLDLCTGSGCIAVSLARLGMFGAVTASDLSDDALTAARENAALNGCKDILFVKSDLFDAFDGKTFDVITVNPPYIRDAVIGTLMPEVRDHDPYMALSGGEDGLIFYRRLAAESGVHLNPGGRIFMEIGHDQAEEVEALLGAAGFAEIRMIKDLGGNPRVICCRK